MNCTTIFPKVGIIGGAGPMAGILLFQKIVQIAQDRYGCCSDADFPYVMLVNYPFADMLQQDSRQKKLLQKQLEDCFFKFKANEISIAAIACNTLHEFLDSKLFPDNIAFVHMIQETGCFLRENGLHESIILCTDTSAQCKLHKKYFNCSYPEKIFQGYIQDLIYRIMKGEYSEEDSKMLASALNSLSSEKVSLVLGCTELSVFNDEFPLKMHGLNENYLIVDPNLIVAEKICSLIFNNR